MNSELAQRVRRRVLAELTVVRRHVDQREIPPRVRRRVKVRPGHDSVARRVARAGVRHVVPAPPALAEDRARHGLAVNVGEYLDDCNRHGRQNQDEEQEACPQLDIHFTDPFPPKHLDGSLIYSG